MKEAHNQRRVYKVKINHIWQFIIIIGTNQMELLDVSSQLSCICKCKSQTSTYVDNESAAQDLNHYGFQKKLRAIQSSSDLTGPPVLLNTAEIT